MGLDHAIVHVAPCPGGCDHYHEGVPFADRLPHLDTVEHVITWRKENHIHAWFIDNVIEGDEEDFNCTSQEVSLEQLAGLAVTIERSLADSEYAVANLSPRSGFFFGSTEMDDRYRADLERELVEIRDLLTTEAMRVANGEQPRRFAYWAWW